MNEIRVFGGGAGQHLAPAIAGRLGTELGRAELFKFANDNTFVKIEENVRERDVFVVQSSVPPVDQHFMELLIMIDALRRASARRITAVLPHYPYSRSDRKDQPRIPITARLVADLITTAGADRVMTVDLHSDQIQGFFTIPLDHLTARPIIVEYLRSRDLSNAVVVAPDAGGATRATEYAKALDRPMAVMNKHRLGNKDMVEVTSVIGDVEGRHAFLVEDEIDTAGTATQAAEVLLERGAVAVSIAATHAVLSGPAVERLRTSAMAEVIVTDTVPVPEEKRFQKLTVLSIADLLAEAIKRTHGGESISSLF